MVLKGLVITQPSMVFTVTPLMATVSRPWSKSAATAGSAVVGQTSRWCVSRMGPRVSYTLFATSRVGRKSTALDLRPRSAKARA
jgi:hypothetical protein